MKKPLFGDELTTKSGMVEDNRVVVNPYKIE